MRADAIQMEDVVAFGDQTQRFVGAFQRDPSHVEPFHSGVLKHGKSLDDMVVKATRQQEGTSIRDPEIESCLDSYSICKMAIVGGKKGRDYMKTNMTIPAMIRVIPLLLPGSGNGEFKL